MMSLVKDPEITTTIEVESLRELIQMINDHKDAIKIALDALGKVDAYWFDASTEEGACAICDSNMHENVMDKHGQINGDSCAFEVAHKAIQKIKELTEEKKDGN